MKNYNVFVLLFFMLLISVTGQLQAQRRISINDPTKPIGKSIKTAKISSVSENTELPPELRDAVEEYGEIHFNPRLKSGSAIQIGDEVEFNIWYPHYHTGKVISITEYIPGITGVLVKISGFDFAYGIMAISDKGVALTLDIPETDVHASTHRWNGKSYLVKYSQEYLKQQGSHTCSEPDVERDKIQQEIVKGETLESELRIAPRTKSHTTYSFNNLDTEVTLRLMYVYTSAALEQLKGLGRDRDHEITLSMMESQLALDNSQVGIRLELARIEEVEYDIGSVENVLPALVFKEGPIMQEVNDIRDAEDIDIAIFVIRRHVLSTSAGAALAPASPEGDRNRYGFVTIGALDLFSGYSLVHEIAHTFGCQHHLEQSYNPAAPGRIYKYATAWKGKIGDINTITIMGYGESYFHGGVYHGRIPFFSSPDMTIKGTIIGDQELSDNALVLRRMKHNSVTYGKGMRVVLQDVNTIYGSTSNIRSNIFKHNFELRSGDKIVYSREPGDIPGTYEAFAYIEDTGGNDVTDGPYYRGNINILSSKYIIAPKPLGSPRIKQKVYDGTTNLELDFSNILVPVLEGDDVNLDTSEFSASLEDPNVSGAIGSGYLKKVIYSGTLKFNGSKLFCYQVPDPTWLTSTSVLPAPLTIAAKEIEMVKGDDPSAINLSSAYTITGLVNGETESVLSGNLRITIDPAITSATAPGVYQDAIQITGYTATNYEITYQSAPLIIKSSAFVSSQRITFNPIPDQIMANGTYQLVVVSSSGLPLTYTSSDPSVATVDASGLVTLHSPGNTTITASQPGNASYDPATPVSQLLTVISNSDNNLSKLLIDGVEWDIANKYVIDCEEDFQKMDIQIITNEYAKVWHEGSVVIDNKIVYQNDRKAFIHSLIFSIEAQNGTSQYYTLNIEKNYKFDDIIIQSGNTLTLDNNPVTNGGYSFQPPTWSKNGVEIPVAGFIYSTTIDTKATYSAELLTYQGERFYVCPKVVEPYISDFNITISPNPVSPQKTVFVYLGSLQSQPGEIKVELYDLNGKKVYEETGSLEDSFIFEAPSAAGTYIMHITTTESKLGARTVILYVQ